MGLGFPWNMLGYFWNVFLEVGDFSYPIKIINSDSSCARCKFFLPWNNHWPCSTHLNKLHNWNSKCMEYLVPRHIQSYGKQNGDYPVCCYVYTPRDWLIYNFDTDTLWFKHCNIRVKLGRWEKQEISILIFRRNLENFSCCLAYLDLHFTNLAETNISCV